MSRYYLNYLDELESESIYVLREVWAQFKNPVILFSGGKDSIVLTHLATKAFSPLKIPFPLLHVDTGHNFPETIEFRDRLTKELGVESNLTFIPISALNGDNVVNRSENSSWYKSVKIFRQKQNGNWKPVFQSLFA
mgnify:CR=1 FL=1